MTKSIIKAKYSSRVKLKYMLNGVFIISVYVSLLFLWTKYRIQGEYIIPIMIFIFLILLYSIIDMFLLKYIISDKYVERVGINKFQMKYDDVIKISIDNEQLELYKKFCYMKISKDIDNRHSIIEEILKQTYNISHISIIGDDKVIDNFMKIKRS